MKDLGKKLRRTVGKPTSSSSGTEAPTAQHAADNSLRDRLQAMSRSANQVMRADQLPRATEIVTPHGTCLSVDTRYELGQHHGDAPLTDAMKLDYASLEKVVGDERLANFRPEHAVFLDIEATGLDHGAGTYAFVIGLGLIEDNHFLIRQLFLRAFEEEMALLHVLTETLESRPYLVSFNGKSYDLTVLQTRLVIQRFFSRKECELKLRPHLDLLHISRNLFKGRWENTRLQTLEAELLGFTRIDDIPGSLVPTFFYHYLRTGDATGIQAVLDHNLWDILSMVSLCTATGKAALGAPSEHPLILENVARVLLRRGYPQEALDTLDRVNPEHITPRSLQIRSELYKQLGDTERYFKTLLAWVDRAPDNSQAWIALAIVQEHKQKDLTTAYQSALKAWEISSEPAIEKRLRRLERKLSKVRNEGVVK